MEHPTVETLRQLKAYIEEHEHPDDGNVPCVYTKRLRQILGMPESPL